MEEKISIILFQRNKSGTTIWNWEWQFETEWREIVIHEEIYNRWL